MSCRPAVILPEIKRDASVQAKASHGSPARLPGCLAGFTVTSDSPVPQCGAMLSKGTAEGWWTPCCCGQGRQRPGLSLCRRRLPPLPLGPSFAQGLGGEGSRGCSQQERTGAVSICTCTHGESGATGHRPWEAADRAAVWGMVSRGLFSSQCNHCVQWRPDHALLETNIGEPELGGDPGQWQVEGKEAEFHLG